MPRRPARSGRRDGPNRQANPGAGLSVLSPPEQESMVTENVGRVVQIIGPVVDVEFEKGIPPIYNAVRITSEGEEGGVKLDVITEVEQHLGENRVRCVSMLPTDGMVRGMKAIDTGGPITVPVGEGTLGRVMNVIGDPVDNLGDIPHQQRYPIHRHAPSFEEQ